MKGQLIQGIKGARSGPKNLMLRALDRPLRPRWLVFMTTDRCNSHCQHCDIWNNEPIKDPLTPGEIEKALGDPLFRGVEYILNTGGEPSLRSDLAEVILTEHKVLPGASIQISTNGLLPERVIAVVKSALEQGIKIDLGTSIDGLGEKHDRIRGVKGNFEKVDYLLRQLVSLREHHWDKLSISAQMTLFDSTVESLNEVREYARKLDIDLLEGWYNEAPFYDNIGRNQVSRQLMAAVESQPVSLLQEKWLRVLNGKSIKFPCFAMYTFCVLKCNGDMVPCLNLWDVRVGNVKENSPWQIWHSEEARKARRMVKNCPGCLNSWGAGWSFESGFLQLLSFYLRHPGTLLKDLNKKAGAQ